MPVGLTGLSNNGYLSLNEYALQYQEAENDKQGNATCLQLLCHSYLMTAYYIICKEKVEVVFQIHANARNPKEENNLYFK